MELRLPKYHLPAKEVRRMRRSLGETQAEFAKRLCVDAVTIARWETNQRKCTGLYAKTINDRKFLPIPGKVSFAFARFLSVLFAQLIKILVPEFDDSCQLEALRNSL